MFYPFELDSDSPYLCEMENFLVELSLNRVKVIMVAAIPTYYGFSSADSFMESFKSHIQDLSSEAIDEIMKIYRSNNQCTNRGRHAGDMVEINKYLVPDAEDDDYIDEE